MHTGRQLTPRALALGAIIGAVACVANLYVGLKTGVAFPVAVTACLVGVSLERLTARAVRLLGRSRTPLSLVELSTVMSLASAAGYSTGGTIISVSVAHLILSGAHLPGAQLFAWTLLLALLGALFAWPLRRSLIDRDALPFPSGAAAATAAKALHASDGAARTASVRLLTRAAGLAGVGTLARELALVRWTSPAVGAAASPLLLGVGMMLGLRVCASLLPGALVQLSWRSEADAPAFGVTHWLGTSVLVTSALAAMLGQAARLSPGGPASSASSTGEPRASHGGWLLGGIVVVALATVFVATDLGIPAPVAVAALLLSFVVSAVCGRVAGQTDVTLSGPLSQVVQVGAARVLPNDAVGNVLVSSIAGNTASAAADLLTDLKAGQLLGASPSRQLVAQLLGCLCGAAVIVPAFHLLVPSVAALGPGGFPAPAGEVFAQLGSALATGLSTLSADVKVALALGAVLGPSLAAVEQVGPRAWRRWSPSPVGLGLSFLLPPSMCAALFVGACLVRLFEEAERAQLFATGLIAGESVVGLCLALWLHALE